MIKFIAEVSSNHHRDLERSFDLFMLRLIQVVKQ